MSLTFTDLTFGVDYLHTDDLLLGNHAYRSTLDGPCNNEFSFSASASFTGTSYCVSLRLLESRFILFRSNCSFRSFFGHFFLCLKSLIFHNFIS